MNRLTKAAVVALALSTTAAPMLAEAQSRDRREYPIVMHYFTCDRITAA